MNFVDLHGCDNSLVSKDMYHPALSMLMVVHGIGPQLDVNNNIRKSSYYYYANGNFSLLYQLLSWADWSDVGPVKAKIRQQKSWAKIRHSIKKENFSKCLDFGI